MATTAARAVATTTTTTARAAAPTTAGVAVRSAKEELPVYGPETPAWLRPGGVPTISAESGWEDGVVALALGMRTPVDPNSEIKGTLYGIQGVAPSYLEGRRPWEDVAGTSGAREEDRARTSGSVEEDGRFPSLVDLFLRHRRSLEVVQELIRGIKEHTKEEIEHWGPRNIRLRCSMSLEELNIVMNYRQEAEKWEQLEELRLWMKHVLGLMSDIVNNGLGQDFFVRTPQLSLF
jgi:hypothetical protein